LLIAFHAKRESATAFRSGTLMLQGGQVRRHPTAYVAPNATVIGDVTLGPRSSIWFGTVLRADFAPIEIGEASNIQDLAVIHVDRDSPCIVGPRVSVGHRAILHGCRIESDCLIGMGSILLSRVVVGRGSVVAAGTVIPEDVVIPPGSLVMGMPGRVKGAVDEKLARRIQHACENYVLLAQRHRAATGPG
jgi:carbonic anhydrase/acetyltransferase-like protein (isoleucine patch superfamily)